MKSLVCILSGLLCLAFETQDIPPPTPTPPPVGYKIYKLSDKEASDMAILWLKANKLPVTGDVYVNHKPSSGSYIITFTSSSSFDEGKIRIYVSYPK